MGSGCVSTPCLPNGDEKKIYSREIIENILNSPHQVVISKNEQWIKHNAISSSLSGPSFGCNDGHLCGIISHTSSGEGLGEQKLG